jgi:NADPH:quinone reductase-like Zn-dependent oxidoreductase
MKAIVCTKYGPPDVLQLQEVEKPTPKDNEILARIYATAASTADALMRQGPPLFGRLFTGLRKPKSPIPGGCLPERLKQ